VEGSSQAREKGEVGKADGNKEGGGGEGRGGRKVHSDAEAPDVGGC
jgi:hypothetical protein